MIMMLQYLSNTIFEFFEKEPKMVTSKNPPLKLFSFFWQPKHLETRLNYRSKRYKSPTFQKKISPISGNAELSFWQSQQLTQLFCFCSQSQIFVTNYVTRHNLWHLSWSELPDVKNLFLNEIKPHADCIDTFFLLCCVFVLKKYTKSDAMLQKLLYLLFFLLYSSSHL